MPKGWLILILLLSAMDLLWAEGQTIFERWNPTCLEQLAGPTPVPANFWTRKKILAGIQALYRRKQDVCLLYQFVSRDRSVRSADILREVYGRPVAVTDLVTASLDYFVRWPDAVNAALHSVSPNSSNPYEDLEFFYGTRVWTRERILHAIQTLHKQGIDLGTTVMATDQRIVTQTILTHLYGRQTDGRVNVILGRALYAAASREFGGWPAALKAAGIDIAQYQRRGNWTHEKILATIKALHTGGFALDSTSIIEENDPKLRAIIKLHSGFAGTGNGLLQSACRRFGGWDEALTAAGIDPKSVRRTGNKFWTQERVVQGIQALHAAKCELNYAAIVEKMTPRCLKALRKSLGDEVTGPTLNQAARTYFGGWDEALKAAGLDPGDIRVVTPGTWDRTRALAALQQLHLAGFLMTYKGIRTNRTPSFKLILRIHAGYWVSGESLVNAAVGFWGGWDNVLKRIGIDPRQLRSERHTPWRKPLVIKAIQALNEHAYELNYNAIERQNSARFKRIIQEAAGISVPGKSLVTIARRLFGSWDEALKAAGFNPANIRKMANVEWSQKKILTAIQRLHYANIPINSNAIGRNGSPEFKDIMAETMGFRCHGSTFLKAAMEIFGNWDSALRAAGLDPVEIRQYGPPQPDIAVKAQWELGTDAAGDERFSRLFGRAAVAPEAQAQENELSESLRRAVADAPRDVAKLADQVITIILAEEGLVDARQIQRALKKQYGEAVPVEKIHEVFETLRENALIPSSL